MYEKYLIVQLCISSRVNLVLNTLAYANQTWKFIDTFSNISCDTEFKSQLVDEEKGSNFSCHFGKHYGCV